MWNSGLRSYLFSPGLKDSGIASASWTCYLLPGRLDLYDVSDPTFLLLSFSVTLWPHGSPAQISALVPSSGIPGHNLVVTDMEFWLLPLDFLYVTSLWGPKWHVLGARWTYYLHLQMGRETAHFNRKEQRTEIRKLGEEHQILFLGLLLPQNPPSQLMLFSFSDGSDLGIILDASLLPQPKFKPSSPTLSKYTWNSASPHTVYHCHCPRKPSSCFYGMAVKSPNGTVFLHFTFSVFNTATGVISFSHGFNDITRQLEVSQWFPSHPEWRQTSFRPTRPCCSAAAPPSPSSTSNTSYFALLLSVPAVIASAVLNSPRYAPHFRALAVTVGSPGHAPDSCMATSHCSEFLTQKSSPQWSLPSYLHQA